MWLHLDLFARHTVSQLFLVVFKNLLALASLFAVARHHRVKDHLSAPSTNKQLKGSIFVLFQFKVACRQLLEEVVDSTSFFLLFAFVGLGACSSLDNGQKFSKLNFLWTVFIYQLNNLLNLLSVFDQSESDERVFKFVNTDWARVVVVQTVEVLA